MINLPTPGSWVGSVTVSLATTGADATVHEWLFIHDRSSALEIRRTGTTPNTGPPPDKFKDWLLKKDQRIWRFLYKDETLCVLRYTSTYDISLCIETTRNIETRLYPAMATANGAANAINFTGDPWDGVFYREPRP